MSFIVTDAIISEPHARAMARTEHGARDTKTFLIVLCLATGLPWLAIPVFGLDPALGPQTARRMAYAVGLPHTMSTFALYFDRSIRPLFRQDPVRFFYAPVVLAISLPLFFWVAPEQITSLFLVAAGGWAVFHVSRQNIGVMAFTCAARGRPGPTRDERQVLTLVGVAATVGIMSYSDVLPKTGLAVFQPSLQLASILLTIATAVIAVPLLWGRRHDLVCGAIFAQALLFFAPVFFLATDGTLTYGAAHALQYLVFMAFLIKYRTPGEEAPLRGFLVTAVLITVVGAVVLRTLYRVSFDPAIGLAFAFVITHFLMDGSIWRLRKPFQREYAAKRFAFLSR